MDIGTLLGKTAGQLSAGRAFGPPIEVDGTTVIPVAWVAGGGGAGLARQEPPESEAADSGGGFGGVTWPVGVYVVKDGTVRWIPAVDATRIALSVLAIVRTIARLRAHRHARS
jgi:uncharacterized spore protein YtfJ